MTPRPVAAILSGSLFRRTLIPAVACLAVLAAYLAWDQKRSLEERNAQIAGILVHYASDYMNQAWLPLEHFAAKPLGPDPVAELSDMVTMIPSLSRLLAITPDNRVAAASPVDERGLDFPLRFDAGNGGRVLLSRPLYSPATGSVTVFIGARRPAGGLLAAELDLKDMTDHYERFSRVWPGDVIVCDAFGNVISHPDRDMVATQANIGANPLFQAVSRGEKSLVYRSRGRYYLGSGAVVPETGWLVLIRTPALAAFAPALAPMAGMALAMGAVLLLLVVLVRRAMDRRIARPLAATAHGLGRLKSGEVFEPRPDPPFAELASVEAAIQDMTLRVRAGQENLLASLAEKEVLLREIHHRVKNNLQVISSLLYLQSESAPDQASLEMFQESRSRISSMALVHEELYRSGDLSSVNIRDYLHKLAPRLVAAFSSGKNLECRVLVEDACLVIDQAIPFGIMVNELVTNAVKHAFDGRDAGVITVEVAVVDGLMRARVSDNGTGLPEGFVPERTATLGMQLVVQLSRQLGGELSIGREGGSSFTVSFPVKEPFQGCPLPK